MKKMMIPALAAFLITGTLVAAAVWSGALGRSPHRTAALPSAQGDAVADMLRYGDIAGIDAWASQLDRAADARERSQKKLLEEYREAVISLEQPLAAGGAANANRALEQSIQQRSAGFEAFLKSEGYNELTEAWRAAVTASRGLTIDDPQGFGHFRDQAQRVEAIVRSLYLDDRFEQPALNYIRDYVRFYEQIDTRYHRAGMERIVRLMKTGREVEFECGEM